MGFGSSLFLIAIGAVLRYGVVASTDGLNLNSIGLILMIVGILGLVISAFLLFGTDDEVRVRRRRTEYIEEPDERHETTMRG